NAKARPVLKADALKMDDYDTVILGYPNWWGTCPMVVFTFLEGHDFFGKTILPLCTHEGSGMGRSEADIQAACPGAKVEKGLAVTGGRVAQAENDIRKWLERYGF
ncbi:MAG: flavodoxin, partial [Lachnospiraceae bacterium]